MAATVMTGHDQPEHVTNAETGETMPLTPELGALGGAPATDEAPPQDGVPAAPKRRRSGTSGAERARRAKAEGSDKAPKVGATRPRAAARPDIAKGMGQLYAMVGLGVSMVPSGPAVEAFPGQSVTQVAGRTMVAQSAELGLAWENAAKSDPRVREALERLLMVSTFGAVIAAHLPIVVATMAAAGAVPPEAAAMLGVSTGAPA